MLEYTTDADYAPSAEMGGHAIFTSHDGFSAKRSENRTGCDSIQFSNVTTGYSCVRTHSSHIIDF